MINGRVFDWESVRIDTIWGLNIEVQSINYNSNMPSEAAYGRGNNPRGFGRGNLTQKGQIILNAQAKQALDAAAAVYGGLMRIPPFPITVSYSNADQTMQVDVLPSVLFDSIGTEAKQGDTEAGLWTYDLNPLDPIVYNGVPVN
jgi:hypothetical protein